MVTISTRPGILCLTHQMSCKRRNYPVGWTVRHKMMNSKQRYQLLFGGTELVEGGTGWYLWELGQYVAVLAGTWYLVLFCLIIGTFDHFRTNISLAGSYGALLVGWLLVVRTGCSYERESVYLMSHYQLLKYQRTILFFTIVMLQERVVFSAKISPICLPLQVPLAS